MPTNLNHKKSSILRLISAVLVVCFAAGEARFADAAPTVALSPLEKLLADPSVFQVPSGHASIGEIYKNSGRGAGTTPLLIHIQDAHANLSGQENLAATLDDAMSKYGIYLVLSEGGWGDCSLTPIKKIASQDVWKKVARRFLVSGKIQGEEYLNLVSTHPMKIVGVEEEALYDKSVETYRALAHQREKALERISRISAGVSKLKSKMYPKPLLEYEKMRGAEGEATAEALLTLADGTGFDLSPYSELEKLARLKKHEESVNFELANLEHAVLLEELSVRGVDVSMLAPDGDAARANRLNQFAHFQNTFDIAKEKGVSLSNYSNLAAYFGYLKEFSAMDLTALLAEASQAEDALYLALLNDEDSRLVRSIDKFTGLLEAAHRIQMTAKQYAEFKLNEPDIPEDAMLAFLNRKLAERGYFDAWVPVDPVLGEGREALDEFYALVAERDEVFIRNIQKALAGEGSRVKGEGRAAFLITGGYHTANLKRLLAENGYSYLVLTPTVDRRTSQEKYESLLLSRGTAPQKKVQLWNGEGAKEDKSLGALDGGLAKLLKKDRQTLRSALAATESVGGLDLAHIPAGSRLAELVDATGNGKNVIARSAKRDEAISARPSADSGTDSGVGARLAGFTDSDWNVLAIGARRRLASPFTERQLYAAVREQLLDTPAFKTWIPDGADPEDVADQALAWLATERPHLLRSIANMPDIPQSIEVMDAVSAPRMITGLVRSLRRNATARLLMRNGSLKINDISDGRGQAGFDLVQINPNDRVTRAHMELRSNGGHHLSVRKQTWNRSENATVMSVDEMYMEYGGAGPTFVFGRISRAFPPSHDVFPRSILGQSDLRSVRVNGRPIRGIALGDVLPGTSLIDSIVIDLTFDPQTSRTLLDGGFFGADIGARLATANTARPVFRFDFDGSKKGVRAWFSKWRSLIGGGAKLTSSSDAGEATFADFIQELTQSRWAQGRSDRRLYTEPGGVLISQTYPAADNRVVSEVRFNRKGGRLIVTSRTLERTEENAVRVNESRYEATQREFAFGSAVQTFDGEVIPGSIVENLERLPVTGFPLRSIAFSADRRAALADRLQLTWSDEARTGLEAAAVSAAGARLAEGRLLLGRDGWPGQERLKWLNALSLSEGEIADFRETAQLIEKLNDANDRFALAGAAAHFGSDLSSDSSKWDHASSLVLRRMLKGLLLKEAPKVRTAFLESLKNAQIWGNRNRPESLIGIRWRHRGAHLRVDIADQGRPFDLNEIRSAPRTVNDFYYGARHGLQALVLPYVGQRKSDRYIGRSIRDPATGKTIPGKYITLYFPAEPMGRDLLQAAVGTLSVGTRLAAAEGLDKIHIPPAYVRAYMDSQFGESEPWEKYFLVAIKTIAPLAVTTGVLNDLITAGPFLPALLPSHVAAYLAKSLILALITTIQFRGLFNDGNETTANTDELLNLYLSQEAQTLRSQGKFEEEAALRGVALALTKKEISSKAVAYAYDGGAYVYFKEPRMRMALSWWYPTAHVIVPTAKWTRLTKKISDFWQAGADEKSPSLSSAGAEGARLSASPKQAATPAEPAEYFRERVILQTEEDFGKLLDAVSVVLANGPMRPPYARWDSVWEAARRGSPWDAARHALKNAHDSLLANPPTQRGPVYERWRYTGGAVEVRLFPGEGRKVAEIADEGRGIGEETLKALLVKQAADVTTKIRPDTSPNLVSSGGQGLGIYDTYRPFVTKYGGAIVMETRTADEGDRGHRLVFDPSMDRPRVDPFDKPTVGTTVRFILPDDARPLRFPTFQRWLRRLVSGKPGSVAGARLGGVDSVDAVKGEGSRVEGILTSLQPSASSLQRATKSPIGARLADRPVRVEVTRRQMVTAIGAVGGITALAAWGTFLLRPEKREEPRPAEPAQREDLDAAAREGAIGTAARAYGLETELISAFVEEEADHARQNWIREAGRTIAGLLGLTESVGPARVEASFLMDKDVLNDVFEHRHELSKFLRASDGRFIEDFLQKYGSAEHRYSEIPAENFLGYARADDGLGGPIRTIAQMDAVSYFLAGRLIRDKAVALASKPDRFLPPLDALRGPSSEWMLTRRYPIPDPATADSPGTRAVLELYRQKWGSFYPPETLYVLVARRYVGARGSVGGFERAIDKVRTYQAKKNAAATPGARLASRPPEGGLRSGAYRLEKQETGWALPKISFTHQLWHRFLAYAPSGVLEAWMQRRLKDYETRPGPENALKLMDAVIYAQSMGEVHGRYPSSQFMLKVRPGGDLQHWQLDYLWVGERGSAARSFLTHLLVRSHKLFDRFGLGFKREASLEISYSLEGKQLTVYDAFFRSETSWGHKQQFYESALRPIVAYLPSTALGVVDLRLRADGQAMRRIYEYVFESVKIIRKDPSKAEEFGRYFPALTGDWATAEVRDRLILRRVLYRAFHAQSEAQRDLLAPVRQAFAAIETGPMRSFLEFDILRSLGVPDDRIRLEMSNGADVALFIRGTLGTAGARLSETSGSERYVEAISAYFSDQISKRPLAELMDSALILSAVEGVFYRTPDQNLSLPGDRFVPQDKLWQELARITGFEKEAIRDNINIPLARAIQTEAAKWKKTVEGKLREENRVKANAPGTVELVRLNPSVHVTSRVENATGSPLHIPSVEEGLKKLPLNLMNEEEISRITAGEWLILGPGPTTNEILMVLKRFPDIRKLHVVDADENNLWTLKASLDAAAVDPSKIKLYQDDFSKLGFGDSSISAVYSRGVLTEGLGPADEVIRAWASELNRVLEPGGVYVTLGSDFAYLENAGFTNKNPDKRSTTFVAVKTAGSRLAAAPAVEAGLIEAADRGQDEEQRIRRAISQLEEAGYRVGYESGVFGRGTFVQNAKEIIIEAMVMEFESTGLRIAHEGLLKETIRALNEIGTLSDKTGRGAGLMNDYPALFRRIADKGSLEEAMSETAAFLEEKRSAYSKRSQEQALTPDFKIKVKEIFEALPSLPETARLIVGGDALVDLGEPNIQAALSGISIVKQEPERVPTRYTDQRLLVEAAERYKAGLDGSRRIKTMVARSGEIVFVKQARDGSGYEKEPFYLDTADFGLLTSVLGGHPLAAKIIAQAGNEYGKYLVGLLRHNDLGTSNFRVLAQVNQGQLTVQLFPVDYEPKEKRRVASPGVDEKEWLELENRALRSLAKKRGIEIGKLNQRVTALEAENARLRRISLTDLLTGLPNRAYYDEYLEEVLKLASEEGFPVSVIAIDLDKFKDINDSNGHPIGDEVLKYMARVLTGVLHETVRRDPDRLAINGKPVDSEPARWGGEEFFVILPVTDLQGAQEVAAKIHDALQKKMDWTQPGAESVKRGFSVKGHDLDGNFTPDRYIAASFGAAQFRPGETAEELTRRADAALYRAKESGRNQVVVDGVRRIVVSTENFARTAAEIVADEIRALQSRPERIVNIVFATGNTQAGFLDGLSKETGIDWSRVRAFHQDDYLGLPVDHPASFAFYLKKHLYDKVPIPKENIFYINGADPKIPGYTDTLRSLGGADIEMHGIGLNGHLAFAEPPDYSKIDGTMQVVRLSPETIEANKPDYPGIEQNPYAVTFGMADILGAKHIILLAAGTKKAPIVLKALEGPVTEDVPASLLQKHQNVTVLLDTDAASLLSSKPFAPLERGSRLSFDAASRDRAYEAFGNSAQELSRAGFTPDEVELALRGEIAPIGLNSFAFDETINHKRQLTWLRSQIRAILVQKMDANEPKRFSIIAVGLGEQGPTEAELVVRTLNDQIQEIDPQGIRDWDVTFIGADFMPQIVAAADRVFQRMMADAAPQGRRLLMGAVRANAFHFDEMKALLQALSGRKPDLILHRNVTYANYLAFEGLLDPSALNDRGNRLRAAAAYLQARSILSALGRPGALYVIDPIDADLSEVERVWTAPGLEVLSAEDGFMGTGIYRIDDASAMGRAAFLDTEQFARIVRPPVAAPVNTDGARLAAGLPEEIRELLKGRMESLVKMEIAYRMNPDPSQYEGEDGTKFDEIILKGLALIYSAKDEPSVLRGFRAHLSRLRSDRTGRYKLNSSMRETISLLERSVAKALKKDAPFLEAISSAELDRAVVWNRQVLSRLLSSGARLAGESERAAIKIMESLFSRQRELAYKFEQISRFEPAVDSKAFTAEMLAPEIERRAAARGMSVEAYQQAVVEAKENATAEREGLSTLLSKFFDNPHPDTNATMFFRRSEEWQEDLSAFLTELVERRWKEGRPNLTLRSVGASTGEEPYGAALLVRKALEDLHGRLSSSGEMEDSLEKWVSRWNVRIDAFDNLFLNLAKIRNATYTSNRMDDVKRALPGFESRFFSLEREGHAVSQEIRRWVKPVYIDLNDSAQRIRLSEKEYDATLSMQTLMYVRNSLDVLDALLASGSTNGHFGALGYNPSSPVLAVRFMPGQRAELSPQAETHLNEVLDRVNEHDYEGMALLGLAARPGHSGRLAEIQRGLERASSGSTGLQYVNWALARIDAASGLTPSGSRLSASATPGPEQRAATSVWHETTSRADWSKIEQRLTDRTEQAADAKAKFAASQYRLALSHLERVIKDTGLTVEKFEGALVNFHDISAAPGFADEGTSGYQDSEGEEGTRRILEDLFSPETSADIGKRPFETLARVFLSVARLQAFDEGNRRAAEFIVNAVLLRSDIGYFTSPAGEEYEDLTLGSPENPQHVASLAQWIERHTLAIAPEPAADLPASAAPEGVGARLAERPVGELLTRVPASAKPLLMPATPLLKERIRDIKRDTVRLPVAATPSADVPRYSAQMGARLTTEGVDDAATAQKALNGSARTFARAFPSFRQKLNVLYDFLSDGFGNVQLAFAQENGQPMVYALSKSGARLAELNVTSVAASTFPLETTLMAPPAVQESSPEKVIADREARMVVRTLGAFFSLPASVVDSNIHTVQIFDGDNLGISEETLPLIIPQLPELVALTGSNRVSSSFAIVATTVQGQLGKFGQKPFIPSDRSVRYQFVTGVQGDDIPKAFGARLTTLGYTASERAAILSDFGVTIVPSLFEGQKVGSLLSVYATGEIIARTLKNQWAYLGQLAISYLHSKIPYFKIGPADPAEPQNWMEAAENLHAFNPGFRFYLKLGMELVKVEIDRVLEAFRGARLALGAAA